MGFLQQFMRHPLLTGAVAPSSRALAELITNEAELANAQVVVELGPGTGIFTERIVGKLPGGATFLAIEANEAFVTATRRRCPGVRVVHDSAVNVRKHLGEAGATFCDRIICGLPWAWFPERVQDELLGAILGCLRPSGRFLTFAYLQGLFLPAGQRFKKKVQETFGVVRRTRIVWRNLPPAFVYVARKGE